MAFSPTIMPSYSALAVADEQDAALFERAKRVIIGFAGAVRDQHAVLAAFDLALVGAVFLEQAVHDAGAARVRQELAMITDHAARLGAEEVMRVLPPTDGRMSVISALRMFIFSNDCARIFIVHVDDDGFVRLGLLAVFVFAEQHARAADAELEAFAAHRLDQHAELKLAAAGDFEAVAIGRLR